MVFGPPRTNERAKVDEAQVLRYAVDLSCIWSSPSFHRSDSGRSSQATSQLTHAATDRSKSIALVDPSILPGAGNQ